jgi:hypothetical protein
MTKYEHYLFDLNGYLVMENMLSPELIRALNEAIDHHKDRVHIRGSREALDGRSEAVGGRASDALKGTHGRGDFGGFLTWNPPWCRPFRELIALPAALRYMIGTIGDAFRLDSVDGITMTAGSEGFVLHGGGTPQRHIMGRPFFFRFEDGRMHNGLMAISYALTDVGPEDGGFVCVPGSHKANYPCPLEVRRLEMDLGCVKHIQMKAGSGIIFTETLTHGTLPWKGNHERRALIYRYTPAVVRVGNLGDCGFKDEMTPLQRALIEPPYYNERPDILALLEDAICSPGNHEFDRTPG